MIYNHACSHCRKKLRKGLRNAYLANSPIKQRKDSHFSSTSSVTSNMSQPQPWLNERLLRAFDEPHLPDLFPSSLNPSPIANLYNPGGTGYFDCMVNMQNPNIAFDQMLQNLEHTLDIGGFETGLPSPCHGPRHQTEALETDILSPEARAQLQIASELDKFPSEIWWESWPSVLVPGDLTMPCSPMSHVPSFWGLGNTDLLSPCSTLFEDPFLSTPDSCLLDSVFGPSPRPDFQQTRSSTMERGAHTSERKSERKFTFIYEHPGAHIQR